MTKKRQNLIAILGIISVSLITIGISIALFNYSKMGTSDNTITTGGLTFQYTEISGIGRGIAIQDAIPLSDTLGKAQTGEGKVFNFKVSSTTTAKKTIPYTISARMSTDSNLSQDAVKLYLTKVNGNNEEQVLLSKYSALEQVSGVTGYTEKVIYSDIVPENSNNYNQEFNLRMWISDDTDFSDGSYNGKTFKITVNVNAAGNALAKKAGDTLYGKIMTNEIVATSPSLNTTSENDTSGLYKSTDTNTGQPTYYFRGVVDNNYVDFAGQTWRVVRVNEDKSIRLIGTQGINNNNSYAFNTNTTLPDSMYYTNSNAKTQLENWYQETISNTDYDNYVLHGKYFCEQARVAYQNMNIDSNNLNLAMYDNYTPTYRCTNDYYGYGLVDSKIGLITYDETVFAGFNKSGSTNANLLSNTTYPTFTMSPAGFSTISNWTYDWIAWNTGITDSMTSSTFKLYPVINIKGDVSVSGNGTSSLPYKVLINKTKTNPTIKVDNKTLTKVDNQNYDYEVLTTEDSINVEVNGGFDGSRVELYSLDSNNQKTLLSSTSVALIEGISYIEADVIDDDDDSVIKLKIKIDKRKGIVFKDAILRDNNVVTKNVNLKTQYNIEKFVDYNFTDGSMNTTTINNNTGNNYYTTADSYTFDEYSGTYTLNNPTVCKWSECYNNIVNKYYITGGLSSNGKIVYRAGDSLSKISNYVYPNSISSNLAPIRNSLVGKVPCTENCSGLFKTNDTNSGDYSYYFRGEVTNNYVSFAGETWRVVRINEDGTVKLILNSAINRNDSEYGSYKYANANDEEHFYYSNSIVKPKVEEWYENNIDKLITDGDTKKYSNYVETGNYFCEEFKVNNRVYSLDDKLDTFFDYTSNYRCSSGNHGLLNLSVGLLSIDEVIHAGAYHGIYLSDDSSKVYLKEGGDTWTTSPAQTSADGKDGYGNPSYMAYVFEKYGNTLGGMPINSTNSEYLRPVINIKAPTLVKGIGTKSKPYTIIYD